MPVLSFFAGLLAAAEFNFKLPVTSSASVTEDSRKLLHIECTFVPTKLFTKAINVQVDADHAREICLKAVSEYRKTGNSLYLTGLYSSKDCKYENGKVTYYFAVPLSGIHEKPPVDQSSFPTGKDSDLSNLNERPVSQVRPGNKSGNQQHSVTNKKIYRSSLFEESSLEKLELAGYAVRYRKDIMRYIAIQTKHFEKLKNDIDYDCLAKYAAILANMKEQEQSVTAKIEQDYRMVQSEKDKILREYRNQMQKLDEQIRKQESSLKETLGKNLVKIRRTEEKKLAAEKNPARRNELKHSITQINQVLRDLGKNDYQQDISK